MFLAVSFVLKRPVSFSPSVSVSVELQILLGAQRRRIIPAPPSSRRPCFYKSQNDERQEMELGTGSGIQRLTDRKEYNDDDNLSAKKIVNSAGLPKGFCETK